VFNAEHFGDFSFHGGAPLDVLSCQCVGAAAL